MRGQLIDAETKEAVADAVVVVSSPTMKGEQTAVTEPNGKFEVSGLAVGTYRMEIQREGYKPFVQTNLALSRSNQEIDLKLELSPVMTAGEIVEITVDGGAIWSRILSLNKAVPRENLELIPYGRDARNFQAAIDATFDAHPDRYGFSISGSGAPENNYSIGGLRVGDPAFGILGTDLLQDFVQELEVQNGFFGAAYGHASGGEVSALILSGGNDFHGSAFINWSPFEASRRQPGQAGVVIATQQHQSFNLDFGGRLGGPIVKDKLWFFAGFAPQQIAIDTDRIIQAQVDDGTGRPMVDGGGTPITTEVARQTYRTTTTALQFVGNLTYALGENHTLELEAFGDPTKTTGAQGVGGGNEGTSIYDARRGAVDVGLRYAGKLFNKQMLVDAALGYHHQYGSIGAPSISLGALDGQSTAQRLDSPSIVWGTTTNLLRFNNGGLYGDGTAPSSQESAGTVAACAIHSDGFDPCPVSDYATGGVGLLPSVSMNRLQASLNLTNFVDQFVGHHVIEYGGDVSKDFYDVTETFTGGQAFAAQFAGSTLNNYQGVGGFGRADPSAPGMPVFISGATNANGASVIALAGSTVKSDTSNFSYSAYLGDAWNIVDSGVTLYAGGRIEHQKLSPDDNTMGAQSLSLTNVMPRVSLEYEAPHQNFDMQVAYGQYYEEVPLDLAERALSSPTQVTYSTNPTSCADPKDPRSCSLLVAGQAGGRNYAFSGGTGERVDQNLKGQYNNQFVVNTQFEPWGGQGIAVRYLRKWLGRAIEDMSGDNGASYFLANPGETCSTASTTAGTCGQYGVSGLGQAVAEPAPRRVYDGISFTFGHVFSRNWVLDASYTHSSLRGSYPGLFNATTGLHPNSLSEYDLISLTENRDGPLPGDDPNSFKVDGGYVREINSKLRFQIGGTLRIDEGGPLNYLGADPLYGPGEAYILPRGSNGRLPWMWQINLRVGLDYELRKDVRLGVTLDIFNLTDNRAVTSVDENYTYDSVQPVVNGSVKDLAYLTNTSGTPVALNPTFNQATSYQLPFSARLGAKLSF